MNATETRLAEQLAALKLVAVAEQYAALARKNNGPTWIIWPGSWTAKPSAGKN
jgi:hypothetical protein